MRGKDICAICPACQQGSPPPMRGKGQHVLREQIYSGITPAHAGKSVTCYRQHLGNRDHPRPCGEKPPISFTSVLRRGSPPPMRGKELHHLVNLMVGGITPAHAGKRPCFFQINANVWDHPRPCGEKWLVKRRRKRSSGSPPPMRGKESGCPMAMRR